MLLLELPATTIRSYERIGRGEILSKYKSYPILNTSSSMSCVYYPYFDLGSLSCLCHSVIIGHTDLNLDFGRQASFRIQ